jgi:hypothetical protein
MRACLIRLSPLAIALACGADSAPSVALPSSAGAVPQSRPVAAAAELLIERLDADASCGGIVPAAAGAAIEARRDVPEGTACLGGTSDGTGVVALAWREPTGAGVVQTFAADGSARGSVAVEGLGALAPQREGFHAIASAAGGARFVAVAADGTLARADPVAPPELGLVAAQLVPDPAGGAVVLARGTHESGNHWFELLAERRDAAGAPVSGPARVTNGADPTAPMFFGGAVSTTGATLAVWGEQGTTRVAWLGGDGALAGEPGDDVPAADLGLGFGAALELAPLLDGTVALRSDGAWRRRWAPAATTGTAVPAWLAEHPDVHVRHVRGGTAYALVPDPVPAAAPCAQRVELRNAEGRLCGAVTVTSGAGACATGRVEVGRDGTLVQETPPAQEACAGGACSCSVRFWPGLLR